MTKEWIGGGFVSQEDEPMQFWKMGQIVKTQSKKNGSNPTGMGVVITDGSSPATIQDLATKKNYNSSLETRLADPVDIAKFTRFRNERGVFGKFIDWMYT